MEKGRIRKDMEISKNQLELSHKAKLRKSKQIIEILFLCQIAFSILKFTFFMNYFPLS